MMKCISDYIKIVLMWTLITKHCFVNSVTPNKPVEVTGKVTFVCAIYRQKDLSLDDTKLPDILTFCTCVKLSLYYVITARACSAQVEWFVSIIVTPFTNKLLPFSNRKQIMEILNYKYLTLLRLDSELTIGTSIDYAKRPLKVNTMCYVYSFTTPNKLPFGHRATLPMTGKWLMQGGVYEVKVLALYWNNCKPYLKNEKLQQNINIIKTTLCIVPTDRNVFEPCSFDVGAPVICNKKLQGILTEQRPLPQDVPNDFETECYRNITVPLPYLAESFDDDYNTWIENILGPRSNGIHIAFINRILFVTLLLTEIVIVI